MAKDHFNLSGELKTYVNEFGSRPADVQKEYYNHCQENLVNSQLSIPLEQASFMEILVKITGAKDILEVGVYAGFSTLSLALGLPENGRLTGLEIDERFPKLAKPFWQKAGVDDKINIRFGDAKEEIKKILEERGKHVFDLAFIDADKAAYPLYYDYCLTLVRPGGLICIDNVLWQGRVANMEDQTKKTNAIREVNSFVQQDERVDMLMLPLWDGLTLARIKE